MARNIRRRPGHTTDPRLVELAKGGGKRFGVLLGALYALLAILALFGKMWIAALLAVAAAVAMPVITPYVWELGNRLRLFTAPDAVITRGMGDTLKQRIFWIVGPQLIACLVVNAPILLYVLASLDKAYSK